jgi:hypothetical protein
MSLISAESISLDSTFYEDIWCYVADWNGSVHLSLSRPSGTFLASILLWIEMTKWPLVSFKSWPSISFV